MFRLWGAGVISSVGNPAPTRKRGVCNPPGSPHAPGMRRERGKGAPGNEGPGPLEWACRSLSWGSPGRAPAGCLVWNGVLGVDSLPRVQGGGLGECTHQFLHTPHGGALQSRRQVPGDGAPRAAWTFPQGQCGPQTLPLRSGTQGPLPRQLVPEGRRGHPWAQVDHVGGSTWSQPSRLCPHY